MGTVDQPTKTKMENDMKQIGGASKAAVVVGAVLAFLVSGCATSSDSVVGSSAPTTRPSATTSPKATSPARRPTFGADAIRVSSAKLTGGTLTIALVGPQDSTFGLRKFGARVPTCEGRKGTLDTRAASGLPTISVQHYTITCLGVSEGEKQTLLITSREPSFEYKYEKALIVTS